MYLNGIISSTHVLVILTELISPPAAQQILSAIKKAVVINNIFLWNKAVL